MKNKDNKFFNAYYSSKQISEVYPSVSHIDVTYHRSYTWFCGHKEEEPKPMHFEPDSVIRFAVECMNAECTRGYIDLFPIISSMIANRETEHEGLQDPSE